MNSRNTVLALIAAAGIAALGATAWAESPERDRPHADAAQADLTMAQAVTIAEAKLNARVVEAKLDGGGAAQPAFEFELMSPANERMHARVAARGGRLVSEAGARDEASH